MTLRLQFQCYHESSQCRCNNITSYSTKITTEEVSSNLIRCNPLLARYFSSKTFSDNQTNNSNINPLHYQKKLEEPYVSIVQEKNLKILLSDNYPLQNKKKQDISQKQNKTNLNVFVQTSPRQNTNEHQKIQVKNSPNKKKIDNNNGIKGEISEFYKDLRQTSRYLSDTAFRKYFNRQCFQNYGHNNISHPADGIIYGNYLKTHNINPHTGYNNPHDQQTFYQALMSASPKKYKQYENLVQQQNKKNKNLSNTIKSRKDQVNQRADQPIHKHITNVNQIVSDNLSRSQMKQKYNNLKLSKSPKNTRVKNDKKETKLQQNVRHNKKNSFSPKYLGQQQLIANQIQLEKHHSKQITKNQQHISNEHRNSKNVKNQNYQDLNNIKKINQIKKDIDIDKHQQRRISVNNICPVDYVYQQNLQHKLSPQCHMQGKTIASPKNIRIEEKHANRNSPIHNFKQSPKNSSNCKKSQCNNGSCSNCLNKMKQHLKKQAEHNNQLSNRMIGSARKQTLYKNYSLNHPQNANKNPHNYLKINVQEQWD